MGNPVNPSGPPGEPTPDFRAKLRQWQLTAVYPEGLSETEELLIEEAARLHEDERSSLLEALRALMAESSGCEYESPKDGDCPGYPQFTPCAYHLGRAALSRSSEPGEKTT